MRRMREHCLVSVPVASDLSGGAIPEFGRAHQAQRGFHEWIFECDAGVTHVWTCRYLKPIPVREITRRNEGADKKRKRNGSSRTFLLDSFYVRVSQRASAAGEAGAEQ